MAVYKNYNPNSGGVDANDLSFDFDLSGIKSTAELEIGIGRLPAGRYLAFLQSIENGQICELPAVKFVFVVKSGPSKGKKQNGFLFMTERAKPRAILFAKRFGLINEGDCGKTSVRKSWNAAIGKDVVIEVIGYEYIKADGSKGKSSAMKSGGIWRTDNPAVADVITGKACWLEWVGVRQLAVENQPPAVPRRRLVIGKSLR